MSTALAVVPTTALMPAMTIAEASHRYNMLVEFTKTVMVKDQDFGTIQGVNKPCLYKAGAEKLSSLFGLTPAFMMIERTEDWTGRDHAGEPFFYFFYKCQLMRGGEIVGEGDGSCNSWEKKYRYRNGQRKCPQCGAEAIIKGKPEYEKDPRFKGGYLCFKNKGGCGSRFVPGDPAIDGQDIAKTPNPDIAESVNTIQKMAQKRALVAAVLIACNASAFYTQDVEDMRTIDVDYEDQAPTYAEAKAAQQAIVDAALERERTSNNQPQANGGARTAGEIATDSASGKTATSAEDRNAREIPPSTTLGHGEQKPTVQSIEDRRKKQDAEALAELNDMSVKHEPRPTTPRTGNFKMLEQFRAMKEALHLIMGDDRLYYEVLNRNGFKKSSDILDRDTGARVFTDLKKALAEAKRYRGSMDELKDINAELVKQDGEAAKVFWRVMAKHGQHSVADVPPDVIPTILEEVRGLMKEQV